MDLEKATAADFQPHVGSVFRLTGTDHDGLELRLTEVEPLPEQPHAPRLAPFTLVFSGPAQPRLEQRTYRLEHSELGELEIFLVPIAFAPGGGLVYEAVFN